MSKIKSVCITPAAKPAKGRSATARPTSPDVVRTTTPAPRAAKLIASAPSTPTSNVKHKLVRNSFTIPKSEYTVLEGLKVRAANLKRPVKKSQLLRAGVVALHAMTDKALLSAVNAAANGRGICGVHLSGCPSVSGSNSMT